MKLNNNKWFTLVEMLVALTIFSFLVITLFEVYNQTVRINKRLEYVSVIQEDIRKVTRKLKSDFRNYKINYPKYTSGLNYNSNWVTELYLKDASWWELVYYLAKWTPWSYSPCADFENNECFILKINNTWDKINITKNTRIKDLHFYISWKNDWTNSETAKIVISYLIWIPKKNNAIINEYIQKNSFIPVQSTISERLYLK